MWMVWGWGWCWLGEGVRIFLLVSFVGMVLEKFVLVILWGFHGLDRGLFEE